MPDRVILKTKIQKIEEKFIRTEWKQGDDGPTYKSISLGWYVQFDGSTESILLFTERPTWQTNDPITITFERSEQ